MTRGARISNALGSRSALGLMVVGAFLIGEANVSNNDRLVWWGVGVSAIIAGAIRLGQTWSGWPSAHEITRLGRWWTPFLVAAISYFVAFLIMLPTPMGDQPHYELESLGLAYEQTRDMTLNYARPGRRKLVYPFGPLDSHAFRYKPHGELVLTHNVGLPLLLTPAVPWVRVSHAVSPVKVRWPWNLEMIFLAALAAQLLYRILRRLRPHHPLLVAGVWASAVFCAPMVVYATEVYPEIPAVLLALIAVDALLKPPRRATILVGACASTLMPWLHQRFLPIAVLLVLGLAIRALAALPIEQRRTGAGAREAAWVLAPLLLGLVVMGLAFQHWYGSPLPGAPWRLRQLRLPHSLSASWSASAGGFWSAQRGWLPFSPVGILGLASLGYAVARYGSWALFGLAAAGAYLLTFAITGVDPGFSFPARYEVILMPFAALPLLIAASDLTLVRRVFWPLAGLTLYLTLAIALQPPLTIAPTDVPPGSPELLWSWFVHIWPGIIPTHVHRFPDVAPVCACTSALVAVSVAGYFVRGTAKRLAPREQVHDRPIGGSAQGG